MKWGRGRGHSSVTKGPAGGRAGRDGKGGKGRGSERKK